MTIMVTAIRQRTIMMLSSITATTTVRATQETTATTIIITTKIATTAIVGATPETTAITAITATIPLSQTHLVWGIAL